MRLAIRTALPFFVYACAALQLTGQRTFRPEDLFRIRRPATVTWSPSGRYATVELTRPGRTLDGTPSAELALIDLSTRELAIISSSSPDYLGFFNSVWSPNGRRLAFLSVDSNGVVRAWTWRPGTTTATPISGLDVHVGFLDSPIVWADDNRLGIAAWEPGARKLGGFYLPILKGKNAPDEWRHAIEGKSAAVSVLDSEGKDESIEPANTRLWSFDLRTNARVSLARGDIHRMKTSPDGRFISFLRGTSLNSAKPYFDSADVDAAYAAANWGTDQHVIDSRTGQEVPRSSMADGVKPPPTPQLAIPSPRSDARRLSLAPTGDTALFVANAADGTRLWLVSIGAQTPKELWHANEWVKEIAIGKAEAIQYNALDGTKLTAWLLLPPRFSPNSATPAKLPMVTVVYPGTTWGTNPPSSFSIFTSEFEHPQLFAALGYAVLRVSMPEPKEAAEALWAIHFANGVFPAVDAAIARGIIDPDRIAIQGQSNGGYAALSLISQAGRFRSAIASGAPNDFASFYGTFYGAYRLGDSGDPRAGQLLRMLQFEKGVYQFGVPPWSARELYTVNSPMSQVDKVETPVMLVQGNLDFVPIQQGEEYFTALYRQGKRAEFVRYQGEWHTISNRENVLDLWMRIKYWLAETMAPRK
jgi:dipeptidyl aminopeptidase/acylaminoacyl peptidase